MAGVRCVRFPPQPDIRARDNADRTVRRAGQGAERRPAAAGVHRRVHRTGEEPAHQVRLARRRGVRRADHGRVRRVRTGCAQQGRCVDELTKWEHSIQPSTTCRSQKSSSGEARRRRARRPRTRTDGSEANVAQLRGARVNPRRRGLGRRLVPQVGRDAWCQPKVPSGARAPRELQDPTQVHRGIVVCTGRYLSISKAPAAPARRGHPRPRAARQRMQAGEHGALCGGEAAAPRKRPGRLRCERR